MPDMSIAHGKIPVHLKDRRRLVVDAHDVYYLEPPVNKVLPVSRGSLTTLLQAYRRP
jgi:hypothetical protein